MSVVLRFTRLEATELAPALVPMALVAAAIAVGTAKWPLLTPNTRETFYWCAALVGIGQGLLDRRFRASPFLQHRPVRLTRIQAARALGGVLTLAGIIGVFVATRWAVRLTLGPAEKESLEQFMRSSTDVELGAVLWRVWSGVVAQMLLLWASLRFAVSTPGFVAPILLAPFLTGALFVAANMGALGLPRWVPDALAVGVAGVLAVYQGMRA